MRKSILRLLLLCAAITMILTVSAFAESATVTGNGVNVRSGPGSTYPVVDCLGMDTVVTVTDRSNGSWYAVSYDGGEGYMSASFLRIESESAGTVIAVSSDDTISDDITGSAAVSAAAASGDPGYINAMYVRFRSGPASSYSVLGEYSTGTVVSILDSSNGWQHVIIDGQEGYIYSSYITRGTPDTDSETSAAAAAEPTTSASAGSVAIVSVSSESTSADVSVSSDAAQAAAAVDGVAATVNGIGIRFRSGPGSGYTILGTYNTGKEIIVTAEYNSGWYGAVIDGVEGYIYGQYVTKSAESASAASTASASSATAETTAAVSAPAQAMAGKEGYIAGNNVRFRSSASMNSTVLAELYYGDSVTITGTSGEWTAIYCNGQNGYVYGTYVKEGQSVVVSASVTATVSSTASAAAQSVSGTAIANYALQYVGSKYSWGGASPETGFDCSGFVYYVFKHFGITVNRVAADQAKNGTYVSPANLQPGDILCFYSGTDYIGHSGIYIGDGKFVHASTSTTGVIISDLSGYYVTRGYEARRVV